MLELSSIRTNHDLEAVRRDLQDKLASVQQWVEWIVQDVKPFNDSLQQEAKERIEYRRSKLLNDRNLVAALGYPLRKREGPFQTYAAPQIRRRLAPTPPAASTAPYVPEATLLPEDYEHILGVISATAKMLERSPATFAAMGEEQLRDQFLVPLNSHYEGQTSGETFNASGKTDILIRVGDRTIFVAECKIWRGARGLSDALDQLLSYTTWRDTKTAILLFNRNRNLSPVLRQVPEVVRSHAQFKRELEYKEETGFRFVLAHPSDPNREVLLTVLVFDVPR